MVRRVPPAARVRNLEKIQALLRRASLACRHGTRIFNEGEVFGIKGADGRVILPAIYQAVGCFINGKAWVVDDKNRRWCQVGPDGVFVQPLACVTAHYIRPRTHHSPEKLSDDPFENSVLWARGHFLWALGLRDAPPAYRHVFQRD